MKFIQTIKQLFKYNPPTYTEIVNDEFYSESLFEMQVVDPFKYKGRGRPRKSDYSSVSEVQAKSSIALNEEFYKKQIKFLIK